MDIDLLSDFAGAAAALCDSVEDASGGSCGSAAPRASSAAFKRFRRRCGGSSAGGVWLAILAVVEGDASKPPAFDTSSAAAFSAPSSPPSLALRNAFVQKNVRSAFSSLATALWSRRVVRAGALGMANRLAHRVHILPLSNARSSAVVGGRRSMGDGGMLLHDAVHVDKKRSQRGRKHRKRDEPTLRDTLAPLHSGSSSTG